MEKREEKSFQQKRSEKRFKKLGKKIFKKRGGLKIGYPNES